MSLFSRAMRKVQRILLSDLYDRVGQVEYNAFNRRFYAVEQVAEYLVGAQIPGDYMEFGVYQGRTFAHACNLMGMLFPAMRFVACDSFEGLPAPKGLDAERGYSSHFYERQFSCSKEQFLKNIDKDGVDCARVLTIEGWFDKSLTGSKRAALGIEKLACAWIDCDLYESTVPVLNFIVPMLSVGSVVLFDDWRCFRNHPDYGQQRAVREWLEANPKIKLAELLSFGWNGLAFTVLDC
jgi:O-methyltransferase